MNEKRGRLLTGMAVAASVLASSLASAADKEPQIPTCEKRYGTLAVREPENKWWREFQLESPEALI